MKIRFFICTLLATMLVACASLGVPTPDTFNKKLAVGISTVTEIRQTATTLLTAGKITVADATNIQTQADNASAGLTIARSLSGTDLTAADAKLTASITVLTALQAYLALKGAPK